MKITLITQWFPPEQAPIGYMIKELAEALAIEGHKVTIITGFPNHPSGVVFGGYSKKWKMQEVINEVKVIRVWLATSPNPSWLRRIITFLTFTLTSSWTILLKPSPDLIFAVFQPLSVGVTLPMLARVKKAKLILNIQDLHPDVQIELGMIRNPLIIWLLKAIERYGYVHANALAVICGAFKEHCVARGAKLNSVEIIPNWINLNEIEPGNRNNAFRKSIGLDNSHFIVLYAGTVGWVSGAEVLLSVAQMVRDLNNVRIVFVGEGQLVPKLKKETELLFLDNVIFSPFQPREILSQVQAIADISMVSLKKGKGRASVPSKVLGYMAAARPVVALVDEDSETARMIVSSGCGWVLEPENSADLAKLIRDIQVKDSELRKRGDKGRAFIEKNYNKNTITQKYIEFFKNTVS